VHRFKLLFILLLLVGQDGWSAGFPASYYQIDDTAKQKEAFIAYMKTLVDKGNGEILKEREFVTQFFAKAAPDAFRGLNQKNVGSLIALRNKYKIENLFDREAYYRSIDTVPVSLAIAQASLESGWGKSRFAREANNLFGHWTYSGVGLMPQNRADGKTHMIRIFSSLQKSVDGYLLNLNTNVAYEEFRQKRYVMRSEGKVYTGIEASKTMIHYSELKREYIKMLQEMMEQNNLLIYDK